MDQLCHAANRHFKAKQFDDAISAYTEAIAAAAQLPDDQQTDALSGMLSNRSTAYLKLGCFEQALADALECLQLKPGEPKAQRRYDAVCAAATAAGVELATTPRAKDFAVQLEVVTEAGEEAVLLTVCPDWAPRGAQRFRELVQAGYFDDTRFYRVIPGFICQFGLASDPAVTAEWRSRPIEDDDVRVSNQRGTVTFAMPGTPNSRSVQVYMVCILGCLALY